MRYDWRPVPTEEKMLEREVGVGAVLYDAKTINRRIVELGREICVYYDEGELLLIGLLALTLLFGTRSREAIESSRSMTA